MRVKLYCYNGEFYTKSPNDFASTYEVELSDAYMPRKDNDNIYITMHDEEQELSKAICADTYSSMPLYVLGNNKFEPVEVYSFEGVKFETDNVRMLRDATRELYKNSGIKFTLHPETAQLIMTPDDPCYRRIMSKELAEIQQMLKLFWADRHYKFLQRRLKDD